MGLWGKLWDSIVIAFSGKTIAILGAREVGKTRLITFLSKGVVPAVKTEQPTEGAKSKPGRRFELSELNLKLKDMPDIGGSKDFYSDWRDATKEADFIFYLFRADKISSNDAYTNKRIVEDLTQINDWLKARTPKPPIVLVGTHCDLVENYSKAGRNFNGETYLDNLRGNSAVSRAVMCAGGKSVVKLVAGSMLEEAGMHELVGDMFSQVLAND